MFDFDGEIRHPTSVRLESDFCFKALFKIKYAISAIVNVINAIPRHKTVAAKIDNDINMTGVECAVSDAIVP